MTEEEKCRRQVESVEQKWRGAGGVDGAGRKGTELGEEKWRGREEEMEKWRWREEGMEEKWRGREECMGQEGKGTGGEMKEEWNW